MSRAKLEITKTKHQEQVWNVYASHDNIQKHMDKW